jgi:multiple sugar transport system permease protein/putative aldouronate transport system permease protein
MADASIAATPAAAPKVKKIRLSRGDRIYYTVIHVILALLLIIVLYPLIFVVSSSFSSPNAVVSGQVFLWPVEPSVEGYRAVFENGDVLTGYGNTIVYTLLGTLINVALTLVAAYPLSRKDLPGRSFFLFLFTFTMIFNGGMIPTYILIKDLHMINTMWAMIVPGALSVYNMMITKTFLQESIPGELFEAAQIDGCSDFRYFFSIVLPLSKAIIAVLVLFYAIGHWNAYFNAFLYLNDRSLFPLQLFLREILIANTIDANAIVDPEVAAAKQGMANLLQYSLIIVSTVPVMCLYPFVQKYFVKGVMIGSIKG